MTAIEGVESAEPTHKVTVWMGGYEYEQITVPTCRVCNSDYRDQIENALIVLGLAYAMVSRQLPEDHAIPAERIAAHWKRNHVSVRPGIARLLAERRAEKLGRSVMSAESPLVDGVALNELIVQRTWEALAEGSVKPTLHSGIAASKFLADLGEYDKALDEEAFITAIMQYMGHSRAVMDDKTWTELSQRVASDPILKALNTKYAEAQEQRRLPRSKDS